MLKKIVSIILSVALVILVNTNSIYATNDTTLKLMSFTDASWNQLFDSLENMRSESDLVITGTVVSTVSELRYDMVFTKSYIQINKLIKGSVAQDLLIPVLQTGGTYGNVTTPAITDAPLLKKGETYELYLYLTKNSEEYGQYYLISGGYQGVLKIVNKEKFLISEKNTLFDNEENVRATTSNTPTCNYYWNKSSLKVYVPTNIRDRYHTKTRHGICEGINAWANYTDSPSTSIVVTTTSEDVYVDMANYGDVGWDAETTTYYNSSTNICTYSKITVNSYYRTSYYSTLGLWQAIACHEFGHTLGLLHNTSSSASIMKPITDNYYNVNGSPQWTVPKTADITPINAKY